MTMHLLTLPGDGIGPEVTAEALRVVEWLRGHRGLALSVSEADVGGVSIDRHDTPLTDAAFGAAARADAILFGAVGGRLGRGCRGRRGPSRDCCGCGASWGCSPT